MERVGWVGRWGQGGKHGKTDGRNGRTCVDAEEVEEEGGVRGGGGDPEGGAGEAGDLCVWFGVYHNIEEKGQEWDGVFTRGLRVWSGWGRGGGKKEEERTHKCLVYFSFSHLEGARQRRRGVVQLQRPGVLRLEAVLHLPCH